ncbi:MAG: hypothetical protein KAI66_03935 [Lentisphaeria bacterium]|nr:hypothetical protein [Lentisphaeria bacterium]
MNRQDLEKKVNAITGELLREKGYIAFVDVFIKLGYLDQKGHTAWRGRKVPFLEKILTVNLGKINFIMKTVTRNSRRGQLRESLTNYQSWGKGKKVPLRFSKSGNGVIEKAYATHFLRPQTGFDQTACAE